MQFGVVLPSFGPLARTPDAVQQLRALAVAADEAGYDAVWTAEHIVYPPSPSTPYPYAASLPFDVTDPFFDPCTTLAWIAAATTRIRLGVAVAVLPYHQPIPFAKAWATLDVLSGGRAMLGVASGWLREEFELLGVPFVERGARTDEYLAVLRALWRDERVTYRGRWVRLQDAAFFPKPVQRPHLPIWIGGGSPAALRRVARAGDGWLPPPRPSLEALAADIATVRGDAEACGRDPASIGVASSGGATSVAALIDALPALERVGVTLVTVPAPFWARSGAHAIELLQEVMETVRG